MVPVLVKLLAILRLQSGIRVPGFRDRHVYGRSSSTLHVFPSSILLILINYLQVNIELSVLPIEDSLVIEITTISFWFLGFLILFYVSLRFQAIPFVFQLKMVSNLAIILQFGLSSLLTLHIVFPHALVVLEDMISGANFRRM